MFYKKLLPVCLLFSLFSVAAFAGAAGMCSKQKSHKGGPAAKTTLASLAEDNYDIKYLKFNLSFTDTSVYVAGNVATTAQVVASTMATYVFELDTTLNIDSAFINGTAVTVATAGAIRTITLPSALSAGAIFTAKIYYKGLPPGGGGGFFNGITHSVSGSGTHMVFTISDPYVAKNWWPCKQSIPDKIDSVDMFITVPRGVVDGSNGLLVNVDTSTVSGFATYHWKTNYKIDYYLISVAIARYTQYKSFMHFTGSTDSMLVHNFFMDTATFNPAFKPRFDSLPMIINFYSGLFGRYPFWREKYGVCYTTLPGGMEHQTMVTIGVPNTYVIAHELCHQWFGDNVTYKTWGDTWLSEGFATFSEQLFLDHFWSPAAGKAQRQNYLNTATSNVCGRLYVDDTTSSATLFDGTTVYAKGAAVVRMLQYAAPSDSVFFHTLRDYQTTYALGHASTADLKALAETYYGYNLDTFFNQWVYGYGYPIYTMSWDQVGTTVYVKLAQKRSCPSRFNNHFSTHLQLQLHGATADTFIKVYNSADTQIYVFDWAPTMTNVYLNTDIWTLLKLTNPVSHDPKLGVGMLPLKDIKIFPNPTENNWQVEYVNEGVTLALYDMEGRSVWLGLTQKGNTTIPGQKLAPGNYFLKLGDMGGSVKLTHW